MEVNARQSFGNFRASIANNNDEVPDRSDPPREKAVEVTDRNTAVETMSRGKRKAERDQVETASCKKRKTGEAVPQTPNSNKRKAEVDQEGEKSRKRRCLDTPTVPSPGLGTSVTEIHRRVHVHQSKSHFVNTYSETNALGQGGFGTVFAGVRRSDALPVAIKHIPIDKVQYTWVKYGDEVYQEISEVVFLAQAAGLLCKDSEANPGVIRLLDAYKLEKEVLIVMKKPMNAKDIIDFFVLRNGDIPEHEAKRIFKQLVEASLLMHKNKIFHRDIKGENILVSLDCHFPSVKIIDFGLSDFVRDQPYRNFSGTFAYAPPEVFIHQRYEAEQTTVWQIGTLLRNLYCGGRFRITDYVKAPVVCIHHLSRECNDFMNRCMAVNPRKRPCLEELQHHPWLVC